MAASPVVENGLVTFTAKARNIPYFANQMLDPAKYPAALNAPIEFSPARVDRLQVESKYIEDWSDDEGIDAVVYDDDDGILTPSKATTKKIIDAIKDTPNRPILTGGRPATSKKISADLDSEDEIIVRMKNAMYLEKDIAEYLVAQGKIKYNPKTIGTRWTRIKKKLAERQDELLDHDLADWHEGDDDALQEAVAMADNYINQEVQKLMNKKDRYVADYLKTIKPVTNFSAKACKTRLQALADGTAKPTPESVLDPDEEVLAKIQDRRAKEAVIANDKGVMGNAQSKQNRRSQSKQNQRSEPGLLEQSSIGRLLLRLLVPPQRSLHFQETALRR